MRPCLAAGTSPTRATLHRNSAPRAKLSADQNENAGHKRNCPRDKADSQSGECNNADNDQINREQKHANIFRNHDTSIGACAGR
jgi:hypothetical protein